MVVEYAALLVLGVLVGAFGTLVGAGGGFLLVPILLLLYPDLEPDTVTAMSLLVVFVNASSGSVAYARQKRIDFWSGGWFALATLPGSVAGAIAVGYLPRRGFDVVFALVLAVLGAYLLLQRTPNPIQRDPLVGRWVIRRRIRDRDGQTFVYAYRFWEGMAISLVVGFVSSLLGIGGGIVHVPVMAIALHFPVHIATATSHFVLAMMALQATGTHLVTGSLGWGEPLAHAVTIAVGAGVGAQIGARASHRVRGPAILRALGAALVLVSLRLAFSAWRG